MSLAHVDPQGGAVDRYGYDAEQMALIKEQVAKDCTDVELRYFLEVAKRSGLDPFRKQIHAIKRWDSGQGKTVMAIQTGIDGYRLIAHRVGIDGIDAPRWCGADGQWVDVWVADTPPAAAQVTVRRNGAPYTATAIYREYVQTTKNGGPNSVWKSRPAGQLGKCAEALALRMACPEDLAGIYTDDEMGQADNRIVDVDQAPPQRTSLAEHAQREMAKLPPADRAWDELRMAEVRREAEASVALDGETQPLASSNHQDWDATRWTEAVKAAGLTLPDLSRAFGIRNYGSLARAEPEVKDRVHAALLAGTVDPVPVPPAVEEARYEPGEEPF